jgi:hypothetical protein
MKCLYGICLLVRSLIGALQSFHQCAPVRWQFCLHSHRKTLHIILVHIIQSIPVIYILIQSIKPITTLAIIAFIAIISITGAHIPVCSSRHISHLFPRNILRDKRGHGMTDKHICMLDILPQKIPDIRLWRSGLVD